MDLKDIGVMVNLFLAVLIIGTLWRMLTLHLIASSQPHMQHLGKAMSQQY
jgi:hypothetical protein